MPSRFSKYVAPTVALLILAFATGVAVVYQGSEFLQTSGREAKRILIFENGVVDRLVPTDDLIGHANTGMFGLLPAYLRTLGSSVSHYKGIITPSVLAETDVFIVTNPQQDWTSEELAAVWTWVENGGGLLVLGDHTDLLGIQKSLNRLLAPAGIHYNFDSAYPIRRNWRFCLSHFVHPALPSSLDFRNAQVGIGASLSVSEPATPLIVGKYGFSDNGNYENEKGAYLGNYKFSVNERLGNVILSAAAAYGAGRVLAFGDTSTFQNLALPWSFNGLVSRSILWLESGTDRENRLAGWVPLTISGFLFLFGAVILARPVIAPFIGISLSLPIILLMKVLQPSPVFLDVKNETGEATRFAFIQSGNLATFASEHGSGRGIGGLMSTAIRAGYVPLVVDSIPTSAQGNALVLIGLKQTLTAEESNRIRAFASNGGHVIIFASKSDEESISDILSAVYLDIRPVPLGFASERLIDAEKKDMPLFADAWLIAQQENVVIPEDLKFAVVASFNDAPVAVASIVGNGYVSIIADSAFPFDQNIEYVFAGDAANIQLLKKIFEIGKVQQ